MFHDFIILIVWADVNYFIQEFKIIFTYRGQVFKFVYNAYIITRKGVCVMTLGDRLKSLREEKGLTTREVSKMFNLGKSTISNYENDSRKPDYEMLKKLSEFYNVSIDYLVGNIKDKNLSIIKEDLPIELKEVGVEYITVLKELKQSGLSATDISEIIKLAKKIKG